MNKVLVFGILAVVAIALVGVYQFLPSYFGVFSKTSFEDVRGVDPENFVVHQDELGFKIAHPVSFKGERVFEEERDVGVRFSGASTDGTVELLQVTLSNQPQPATKNEILAELTAEERKTIQEGEAFGAKTLQFDSQGYSFRYAFFQCGAQTATVVALVPVELKQDLKFANYAFSKFECS